MPVPNEVPPDHSLDPLTGLLNRLRFFNYLEQIETAPGQVVMAVEIAGFGNVNSSMGSELGDKVIALVANRLSKVFSHASAIGRTNGDHFVLFFETLANDQEELARLQDFVQRPLLLKGTVIVLSVRVGVARGENCDGANPSTMLHAAETALHRAKKDTLKVCYYTDQMVFEARQVQRMENDLRVSMMNNATELHRAISNSEFELVYQPIVDARSNHVHAFEALLRWNHPRRGMISPAVFIPLAEQISVMDVLGSWVIRKACADAMGWPQNPDGSLPWVSVNVSPTQFAEPEILLGAVRTAIKESGIAPERIKLEITESNAFSDWMIKTLLKLRGMGCKIALDDFGTGYSSLTQLHTLPLDFIKLDRSFIKNLCCDDPVEDKRCEKMTKTILMLADVLSLIPIVEGIETEQQLVRVRHLGAGLIQGYVYSKPMQLTALPDFMRLQH